MALFFYTDSVNINMRGMRLQYAETPSSYQSSTNLNQFAFSYSGTSWIFVHAGLDYTQGLLSLTNVLYIIYRSICVGDHHGYTILLGILGLQSGVQLSTQLECGGQPPLLGEQHPILWAHVERILDAWVLRELG